MKSKLVSNLPLPHPSLLHTSKYYPTTPAHINPSDVEVNEHALQFLLGMAEGFGLGPIEDCLKDSYGFFTNIYEAIKDFEKKTSEGVKEGLALLGKDAEAIIPTVKECKVITLELGINSGRGIPMVSMMQ
jgi:hypothetical protein